MVIQEEQDAIYGYTVSYHNINEPLRGLTYYVSQTSAQLGLQRIPLIEGIINKSSYNFDMWLQRGDKLVALKKFGLYRAQNETYMCRSAENVVKCLCFNKLCAVG